jgi:hypothetical protein
VPFETSGDHFKGLIKFGVVPFILGRAPAREELPAAYRAPLDITPEDVELPLDHATIVARLPIGAPVIPFLTITEARDFSTPDRHGWVVLRLFDPLGPPGGHRDPIETDEFILGRHVGLPAVLRRINEIGSPSGDLLRGQPLRDIFVSLRRQLEKLSRQPAHDYNRMLNPCLDEQTVFHEVGYEQFHVIE